jgi:hypothetical protein
MYATDNAGDVPYARAHMKRAAIVILVSAGALAASAAVALAHNTPFAWTAPKARVVLQDEATIALPPAERVALDAELEALLDKFRLLLLTAQSDPDDWLAAGTYDNYVKRFQKAQDTVNNGLSIDTLKCAGQGKALPGKKYKHFRCNTTSYVLEIPNIEFKPGTDPDLPEVVEGPARRIGPLAAVFTVHVMGKSRMLSQRAS